MNESEVQTPSGSARISIEERKSVFSAYAEPVPDAETAKQRIESYRTRFTDSSHCVWAYLCERAGVETRSCNDDGEPRGTAGMPVLRLPWSVSEAFLQAVTDATHGGVNVRDL